MGEIKSVKVDNWGVFFLQKLQNFFNKTDYCDLTLQFRDNSQLKVHRLVLSACTDFFNVLEQTCELIDDALVMPMELQADVVVPIVNFMYTGTLEFELKMYGKLLKTAKEMNMTVLLKLLEAHKRTMDGSKPSSLRPGSPKTRGKRGALNSPSVTKMPASPSSVSSSQLPVRRMITSANSSTTMRRIVPGKVVQGANTYRQASGTFIKTSPKMQRGPTRFEASDQSIHGDAYESSFDAISYESKPLKDEPEEYEERRSTPTRSRSSPFEQLRKGYNNNKRPAVSTFTSPPAKKPNIEDVKEFSEQQRMRKQIAAEYGDDAEYDGILDDEFHNDDDDDEPSTGGTSAAASKQQQQSQQVQPQASIIIKQSPNEKPTIVVKDTSNSKMDHAKIISEVLRQYPHLVKSNKNIKLKIMPNVGNSTQKIVMKKESAEGTQSDTEKGKTSTTAQEQARQQLLQISQMQSKKAQAVKGATVKVEATAATAATTAPVQPAAAPQKRRIDSKTMHALIALGAENTTGPWLCLRCGVNGRPISIPSYRGFRRHLINTHKEVIDSALCEHCGWRSTSSRTLSHHMLVEHKISSPLYVFPTCEHCSKVCVDPNDLNRHITQEHPNIHKQQCIYCNKVFSKESILYNHMKTFHKKRAREDGVIDFSDEEMTEFDEEIKELLPESDPAADKKIKIISDISLPSTLLKLEDVSAPQEDEYANDNGPKFVNADGNEMLLTAEQRDEIMSQLEQDHGGGVVMVLNESAFSAGEEPAAVQEDKLETCENADETEDSHIYSEFPPESESGFNANDTSAEESALEGSKDEEDEAQENENQESEHDERMDVEHMEWAENVISAHDADEEEAPEDEDEEEETGKKNVDDGSVKKEVKEKVASKESAKEDTTDSNKDDDISLKLKMLTGDWSDDEIEDEEEEGSLGQIAKESAEEQVAEAADNSATTEEHAEVAKEQQEPIADTEEKEENENTPVTEAVETEEEVSQSSHSEKVNENDVKVKIESTGNSPTQKDVVIKLEDSTSDTQPETIEAIEREVKRKSSTNSRGSASSRRTSAKDDVAHTEMQEEKSLDAFMEEEPLNVKITSPKKIVEDPLAVLAPDESKESTEVKTEPEDPTEPEKPLSEDTLKTVDKVKSLISEWVDDEDDI